MQKHALYRVLHSSDQHMIIVMCKTNSFRLIDIPFPYVCKVLRSPQVHSAPYHQTVIGTWWNCNYLYARHEGIE